jgi:hypothetical protein
MNHSLKYQQAQIDAINGLPQQKNQMVTIFTNGMNQQQAGRN